MGYASHIRGSLSQQCKVLSNIRGSIARRQEVLPTFAEVSHGDKKCFQHLQKHRTATGSASNICGSIARRQEVLPTFVEANPLSWSGSQRATPTGRCSRSVIRMTKEAQQQGQLNIRQYPLVRRCDDMTRSHDFLAMGIVSPMLTPTLYDHNLHNLDDLIRIGNLGFVRQCNDYLIRTYDLRHRFQHIIYGHRKRLTFNISVAGGGN